MRLFASNSSLEEVYMLAQVGKNIAIAQVISFVIKVEVQSSIGIPQWYRVICYHWNSHARIICNAMISMVEE